MYMHVHVHVQYMHVHVLCLTPSRRAYYIFFGPPGRIIFSENSENISSHYKFLCQWNDVRTTK